MPYCRYKKTLQGSFFTTIPAKDLVKYAVPYLEPQLKSLLAQINQILPLPRRTGESPR